MAFLPRSGKVWWKGLWCDQGKQTRKSGCALLQPMGRAVSNRTLAVVCVPFVRMVAGFESGCAGDRLKKSFDHEQMFLLGNVSVRRTAVATLSSLWR